MQGPILVVNAGSSSIKFSGYAAMDQQEPILLFKGQIEGIGLAPHMTAKDANGATIAEKIWPRDAKVDHEALFDHLIGWIPEHLGGRTPVGVGHRVVHGGTAFAAATRIDDGVLATLRVAVSPGAAASATPSRGDPRHLRRGSIAATGCVLRYRFPPRPAAGRPTLRLAPRTARSWNQALRVPWAFLRLHRLGTAGASARRRAWSGCRRSSRRRRQPLRHARWEER